MKQGGALDGSDPWSSKQGRPRCHQAAHKSTWQGHTQVGVVVVVVVVVVVIVVVVVGGGVVVVIVVVMVEVVGSGNYSCRERSSSRRCLSRTMGNKKISLLQ